MSQGEEQILTNSTEEKYSPRVQTVIEYLEHGDRPWFLSSLEVYTLVKKTVEAIPYSQLLFDSSLASIAQLTKYINYNTKSNLIVLEVSQSHELIEKLDSILSEQLVILDDGLDGLRAKLSSNLRQLLVAIVNHKKWAESKAEATKDATVKTIRTRFEYAMYFVHRLVDKARERFPVTIDHIEKSVEHVQAIGHVAHQYAIDVNDTVMQISDKAKSNTLKIFSKIDDQAVGSLIYLLRLAQPYVHKLVNTSAPLVSKTLSASDPYIQRAKPHVEKIVSKAVDVTNSLKENKFVGVYVDSALNYAQVAIDETKSYVIPPEQQQETAAQ